MDNFDEVNFGTIAVSYSNPSYEDTYYYKSEQEVRDHFMYEDFEEGYDAFVLTLFKHKFAVGTHRGDFKRNCYRLVQTVYGFSLHHLTQDCLETVEYSLGDGHD